MRSALACDVAVIGAGLAGLWCARALARRGARVALVDAAASAGARVRTTGIFVRRTFEEFDLFPAAFGAPIRRVVLYSPKRRALELESMRDEFRIADMRALLNKLAGDCVRAGVLWFPATRYRGLCAEGCCVRLRRGAAEFDIAASYVIGADGARSSVARDLALSRNARFILGAEALYEGCRAGQATLSCFLTSGYAPGYIAWIAHDGRQTHVGVGGNPVRFHAQTALRRFIASLGGMVDFSNATLTERRAGLIPVNGVLPRIACERGLLVGDAAGAVSPLTAGGLDACVRLSEFAAEVAANVVAGNHCALDAYCGTAFERRFTTRRWMRSALEAADDAWLELLCAVLRLAPMRLIAEQIFFGSGSFPDPERAPALMPAP